MGEVREENERLKTTLARIVKEYQSLQLQFYSIVQQEQAKKSSETTTTSTDQQIEESELVSLSLGTTTSGQKKEEKIVGSSSKSKEEEQLKEGLTLGLDCKFEASTSGAYETPSNPTPENSFEEPKEEEVGEAWPPSKILKTLRSGDDEVSQQPSVKKARVSVRARCDTPTVYVYSFTNYFVLFINNPMFNYIHSTYAFHVLHVIGQNYDHTKNQMWKH